MFCAYGELTDEPITNNFIIAILLLIVIKKLPVNRIVEWQLNKTIEQVSLGSI